MFAAHGQHRFFQDAVSFCQHFLHAVLKLLSVIRQAYKLFGKHLALLVEDLKALAGKSQILPGAQQIAASGRDISLCHDLP